MVTKLEVMLLKDSKPHFRNPMQTLDSSSEDSVNGIFYHYSISYVDDRLELIGCPQHFLHQQLSLTQRHFHQLFMQPRLGLGKHLYFDVPERVDKRDVEVDGQGLLQIVETGREAD